MASTCLAPVVLREGLGHASSLPPAARPLSPCVSSPLLSHRPKPFLLTQARPKPLPAVSSWRTRLVRLLGGAPVTPPSVVTPSPSLATSYRRLQVVYLLGGRPHPSATGALRRCVSQVALAAPPFYRDAHATSSRLLTMHPAIAS